MFREAGAIKLQFLEKYNNVPVLCMIELVGVFKFVVVFTHHSRCDLLHCGKDPPKMHIIHLEYAYECISTSSLYSLASRCRNQFVVMILYAGNITGGPYFEEMRKSKADQRTKGISILFCTTFRKLCVPSSGC